MLEPEWAAEYGLSIEAIERRLGVKISIWRESTSAVGQDGEVAEHLKPHLLGPDHLKEIDPRIATQFTIYLHYGDPELPDPGGDPEHTRQQRRREKPRTFRGGECWPQGHSWRTRTASRSDQVEHQCLRCSAQSSWPRSQTGH